MSIEPWQYKKYYRHRVLIGYNDLLDPPLPPMTLVCLTGSELLLLRNVLAYCHRRNTFVVTYGTSAYVMPNNEQWDIVEGIVSELEDKLMSGCEDLLEKFDEIIAAMLAQNVILGLFDPMLSNMLTVMGVQADELSCICDRLKQIQQDPATAAQVSGFIADDTLQIEDPYPQESAPGIDSDACAIAQLVWYFMYETMTEIIHPAQDKAVSILLPLALATIATWVGTPLLGIPVGAVMLLLWNVIDVWVAGRFETVTNAIFSNKDEIICAGYEALRGSGTLAAAAAAVGDVVSGIPELSPLDAVCIRSLATSWVFSRMKVAYENATAWATGRIESGYCASCGVIEGDDWFAVQIPIPDGDLVFNHTPGNYWLKHTYCSASEGEIVGYVGELIEETGDCSIGWNNESAEDCTGGTISSSQSLDGETPPYTYVYRLWTHNDTQAHAMLCPTAVKKDSNLNNRYNDDPFAVQAAMGWACTGTATVRIHYIVYKKV